jgi:hypothetical protein
MRNGEPDRQIRLHKERLDILPERRLGRKTIHLTNAAHGDECVCGAERLRQRALAPGLPENGGIISQCVPLPSETHPHLAPKPRTVATKGEFHSVAGFENPLLHGPVNAPDALVLNERQQVGAHNLRGATAAGKLALAA